jgi:phage baseplate assembly protein W
MAYGLTSISTLDLRPSTGIGLKVPFDYPSAFTLLYATKDQIRNNLINFLLTNKGERPLNPSFGANIRAKLFEQISQNTIDDIKSSITMQIENNFPTIQVTEMTVTGDPDRSGITIKFTYQIINTAQSDVVTLVIQNA